MKFTRSNTQKAGFTLVEIMIVVLIIGILLAIAIPNFVAARESSRAKACVGNLKQIDSAKQQAAMDNKLASGSTVTFILDGTTASTATTLQLVGTNGYIRATPACPEGGVYKPLLVNSVPICTVSDNAAARDNGGTQATLDAADYGITAGGVAGKWYHGLVN